MYSTYCITYVHLRLSTPHILLQMYSLDYPLHRLYHTCTASIIYCTDYFTYVQLRLLTPQMLSHVYNSDYQTLSQVYSLDYLLHRCYHKSTPCIIYSTYFITCVQLRSLTPHILSQMHILDYLLHRFYHKCTPYIIYSANFITCV